MVKGADVAGTVEETGCKMTWPSLSRRMRTAPTQLPPPAQGRALRPGARMRGPA